MREITGKLKEPIIDYKSGKILLVFEANEDVRGMYEELKGFDKLVAKIGKYRARRSLDANAYFHVLVGYLAEANNVSKTFMKNKLIIRYGQYEYIGDSIPTCCIDEAYDDEIMEREGIHLEPIGTENYKDRKGIERTVTRWAVKRGSHTYDTKEMSELIKGTVSECHELGIDTITPTEIDEMMQRWGIKYEKKHINR